MNNSCYFSKVDKCRCPESQDVSINKSTRIKSIIRCSKTYVDKLDEELEQKLESDNDASIYSHRACVSTYTSPRTLDRCLKRKREDIPSNLNSVSQAKQRRRSCTGTFDFKQHCIFCGNICVLSRSKKNPGRWRKAYLCRTLGSALDVKDEILKKCSLRGDKWADDVKVRLLGAVSDLHAADARYHVDCKAKFMTTKHVNAACNSKPCTESSGSTKYDDVALEQLCKEMLEKPSHIWNTIELFDMYTRYGGKRSRRTLLDMLVGQFEDDLLLLKGDGVASIILFKANAPSLLKVVNDTDDSIADIELKKVAKNIAKECKNIEISKKRYNIRLQKQTIESSMSETLMKLLSKISDKLENTPSAYLIGSIITSAVTNFPTPLQIALGVLIRNSKGLVNQMNSFGVTCTYDEVLRFKKSAAVAATSSTVLQGISDSKNGLVQVVVDNFDCDISSQNGKLSTHSLAMLVTQPESTESNSGLEQQNNVPFIRRVDKNEMSDPIDFEINVEHYHGPKKVEMPETFASKKVLPLKMLAEMAVSLRKAHESDIGFLKAVTSSDTCPESNGYNTKLCRQQHQIKRESTKAVYLPLIDRSPSDPDTINTSLRQAQLITNRCGQSYTVFTSDLQLYKIALNIIWAHPDQFSDVVLRLGGMHTLMSFIGSVGTLMEGSGLTKLLESTFGGVLKMLKMLAGKKFPQNFRALRLLTEELLREVFETKSINRASDLDRALDLMSADSRTCRLWIDCVIKAVLVMMIFVRAERENLWCLHLCATKAMIPYFFAAGHVNYARYCLYYLRSMESMPNECRDKFLDGQHAMRHTPGIWNGIWSDMFIETTFMRYGHGKKGIIGLTLKPDTMKIWSLGLHICSRLEDDVAVLTAGDEIIQSCDMKHKEEMKSRIRSDAADRQSLRNALSECIHPLKPASHPEELVNVITGQVAPELVNVDKALEIGMEQMKEFENGWPNSFHQKISRRVKTQTESSTRIRIGDTKVFDTELIFTRVIGIQASSREFDVQKLLTYELSPVPTAMFDDTGEMRIAKSKSVLKKTLQCEISERSVTNEKKTLVIDGSAILYIIPWPLVGTIADYVAGFRHYIERQLSANDVYLVFDRYKEYSTKSATRISRGAQTQRVHQLSTVMQIPQQKTILCVPKNKSQLIALIVADLRMNTKFPENIAITRKLVVTGEEASPIEITQSVVIQRHDIRTTHEEADNIIVQQAVSVAKENDDVLVVLSDDTDVFVLLLYHYFYQGLTNRILMESPVKGRSSVDITETVKRNKAIIPNLLAAHALSGSDTTATYYGIGKGTVVKTLKNQNISLSSIGDESSDFSTIMQQATCFISHCYNIKTSDLTMSQIRQKLWSLKVGKSSTCAPKLASLPPTTEAFAENVKRAHMQTCIWKHAINADPPDLDPESHGWRKEEKTRTLVPIMLPTEFPVAPDNVLKMIKCSCDSLSPCSTLRCRCKSACLSCTIFCNCRGSENCFSEHTMK